MSAGSPDVLHVACSCAGDGRYAPHSAAMLHSVLAQRGVLDVAVHYLHGPGFPARTAERIAGMVERAGGAIAFHAIADDRVAGLPVLAHAPASLWYRVFLPELLPDVDRVLYLDLDALAVDDLDPLWATELGDHPLAAVTNVWQADHVHHAARLGLARPDEYFNSGVMLMNLRQWRAEGATDRVLAYARERRDSLWLADQDAMNVLLGSRRLHLHPRWNCMNSVLAFPQSVEVFGREAVEEARAHPGIRHFEGPSVNKPWHFLCERGMHELYDTHRRATPWPRYRPEGITPANVVRRLRRAAAAR